VLTRTVAAFAALASGVAAGLSLAAGRVVSECFLVGLEAGYSCRFESGALARPGLDSVDPRFLLALTRYFGDRR
jgi:hypothetical protein